MIGKLFDLELNSKEDALVPPKLPYILFSLAGRNYDRKTANLYSSFRNKKTLNCSSGFKNYK